MDAESRSCINIWDEVNQVQTEFLEPGFTLTEEDFAGFEAKFRQLVHVDGCCVLPVDEDGNLILVSQYRNAVDDITLEVPAGCMDEGEDPGQCAVRELEEETGYIAQELQFVTKTYLAIGTSNEQTYIYIATDLKKGIRQPDPEEFIRIRRIPLAEAMTMIQAGEIVDSKTIIAILAYAVPSIASSIG